MNIGSLFSGIGGLEAGLSRAIPDAQTVWQVEQDEYARAVLAKHWPDTRRFEDVREVGAHNLERVDLICGGFPCQDISVAGRGAGIDGERSGLWSEFARIIGELVPRFVIVENSPALNSRGMGRVLGDLAALGYDAIWDCIPAAAIGAPHRRDRVFIVAYSNRVRVQFDREPRQLFREAAQTERKRSIRKHTACGSCENCTRWCDSCGELWCQRCLQHRAICGCQWGNDAETIDCAAEPIGQWTFEPGIRRVADGVPHRMDRLRCLGNAVVPQVAEVVGRVVVELEQEQRRALNGE